MGKKKSFTSSALASLTGETKTATSSNNTPIEETTQPKPEPVVEARESTTVEKPTEERPTKPVAKKSAKATTRRTTKKKKPSGLQDPNKRSIKKSHVPVTLYLNATNLERLKEYAEDEEQKISWLIDEMIFDYLSDRID